MGQAEFIDMGSLSREIVFNITAWGIRKGSNWLIGWLVGQLAEMWTRSLPTVRKKYETCPGLM